MNLLDLFARISLDTTEYEQGLNRAGTLATGFATGVQSALSGALSNVEDNFESAAQSAITSSTSMNSLADSASAVGRAVNITANGVGILRDAAEQATAGANSLGDGLESTTQSAEQATQETRQYAQETEHASESTRSLMDRLRDTIRSFTQNSQESDTLSNRLAVLNGQYEQARGKVRQLSEAFNESIRNNGVMADRTQELARELQDAERAADGLEHEIDELSGGLDEAGTHSNAFFEILKANLASEVIISGFKKLIGFVTDFAKSSIDTGKEFDSAMSQIMATLGMTVDDVRNNVDGAGDKFNALREKALEMGAATVFSAKDAADGLNILAMSGYDATNSIAMIEDVLHLAAAGSIDMANAAGYISGAMKGFSDETKDSAYYADLMAKGATLANTSVQELGEAMSAGAASAAGYKQSAESMTLALLRLAEQSVTGSAASTALAAAMKEIYTPTDQASKVLKKLGVEAYDSISHAERDFNLVIDDLSASLSDYTEQQKNAYLNTIFGAQGLDAYNKLIVTSTEDQKKWTAALEESAGEAAKQYSTMTDNLAGDLAGFDAAMEGLKISLSDSLSGMAREFVQFGTNAIGALNEGFKSDGLSGLIAAGAEVVSNLTTGITNAIPQMAEAAGNLMTDFGQSLQNNLPVLIQSGLEAVVGLTASIRENAGKIADGAIALAKGLAQGLVDSIPTVIENVPTIVSNIADVINDNAPKILVSGIEIIITLVKGLIQAIPTLIENIPKIVSAIVAVIVAYNWVSLGSNIITWLKNGINALKEAIPNVVKNIGQKAKNFITNIDWHNVGTSIIRYIRNGINFLRENIPKALKAIGKAAIEKVKSIDWLELGKNIVSGIAQGIRDHAKLALDAAAGLARRILHRGEEELGVSSPSKEFAWVGRMVDEGFAKGIEENADKVEDKAAKLAKNVYSAVTAAAERQIKYERLSLTEQLELWRAIQEQFVKESDQWWDAEDKIFDLRNKLIEEEEKNIQQRYSSLTTWVNRVTKFQNLSVSEQLRTWEAIQRQFVEKSDQWWDAEEKIFDLREKKAQEEENLLKNLYQTLANSAEKQVKREKLSLIEQLNVWLDIQRQFLEGSEQYASAEEKIYDLREDIQEEYYAKVKEVNANIAALEENYQKTLESRTKEIFNSYKLFDEIPKQQSVSGEKLISNLKGQINSIQGFYSALERLEERGAGAALVSELRDMGPSAMSQLDALLQLSDQRLSEYAGLYEEKQQLANSIAIQELRELRTETDAQIREQLASVEDLYEKNAPVVGEMFPQGLAKGILSGMSTAVSAAVEVAKAVENAIREKTETHSPSRLFARIGQGMAEGLGIGWTDEYRHIKDQIEDGMNFKGATATVDFASTGLNRLATATGAAFANMMTGIPDNNGEIVVNITAELDGAVLARKMVRYNRDERFLRGGAFS